MSAGRKSGARSLWQIFRWPLAIGAASVVGLISALIGDDWYDRISWIALGLPVVVMIVAWRRQAGKPIRSTRRRD